MVNPDCVLNDLYVEEALNENLSFSSENEIDEWDHKWGSGTVTYKLLKGKESKSFPDSSFEHRALTIALRTWGLRTKNIKFKRIYKENEVADIEVKFQKREEYHYFKEKKGVLASAYFPHGR